MDYSPCFVGRNIGVPRGGKYGLGAVIVTMIGIYNALSRYLPPRQGGAQCESRKVGWGGRRGDDLANFLRY